MIIATAGHIDHGKTALVRALTGVDTDRLPEERARGITIEVGFAHRDIGDITLGFVDVPGHERFVRNMLGGVYAIGHVLLIVAADDGVMPQTREHLQILDLLGVSEGTLVITKKDRADATRLAQVEREVRDLVRSTLLQDAPIMAVSALSGDAIPALLERLVICAKGCGAACGGEGYARYVVDRVFTSPGSGTIVTGTVIAGSIGTGDRLVVSPAGKPARARKLQRHGRSAERALAGERCAINLAGVEHAEVARGDWIVAQEVFHPTDRLDVRLKVLPGEAASLKHWTPVHVHIGAADVPARLALRRGASIAPGEIGFAQLRLARPVQASHGDRLILRDQSSTRTLGGGTVLNPLAATVRRADREAVLNALDTHGVHDVRSSLQALMEVSRNGLKLEWLAQVFSLPLTAVTALLQPDALVVKMAFHTVFSDTHAAHWRQALPDRVRRFHAQQTASVGMELGQLHAELCRAMPFEGVCGLVQQLAARCGLRVQGSRVRLATHESTDNPRDQAIWQRLKPMLMHAAAAIPSVRELATQSNVPLYELSDLMHRKAAIGELIKLTSGRMALPETVEMLANKAVQTAAGRPDVWFTAAQYRDVIGTGRSLAIEILECLDRCGATQRRGDLRCVRAATASPER